MRQILFLVLMLSSIGAWAEDYQWYLTLSHGSHSFELYHEDPSFICDSFSEWRASSFAIPSTVKSFKVNGDTARCDLTHSNWGGPSFGTIRRKGDSCPEGTNYNPETGTCDEPDEPEKCESTQGMGAGHMFLANTRTNPYDPWPSGSPEAPYSVCRAGCRFTADSGAGKTECGTLVGGDPLQQFCVRMYTGQGVECQGGEDPMFSGPGLGGGGGPDDETPPSDDPLDFPPLSDPGDPTDPSNNCGPGYVWTGTTCAKIFNEKEPTTPGTGGGGSGGDNGGGDGGDPGGGGDGDTGGDGGTGGTPGGGGGGDRDDKNNVKGVACEDERPVECTGDAYDCAIFWHTREQNCRMEELLDYGDEQKQQMTELLEGEEYHFTEDDNETIELEGFINQGSRFLPASCPPPISIALSGRSFQLDTGPFCSFADALGYLIVAFATLAGALYVGRAFGGE